MSKFREEQRLIIVIASISGMYMPSVEKVIPYKCVTYLLKHLTWLAMSSQTAYVLVAAKHMIFDQAHYLTKTYDVAVLINCGLNCYKSCYYNLHRRKFEKLFDFWDSAFKGDLFSDLRQVTISFAQYIFVQERHFDFRPGGRGGGGN